MHTRDGWVQQVCIRGISYTSQQVLNYINTAGGDWILSAEHTPNLRAEYRSKIQKILESSGISLDQIINKTSPIGSSIAALLQQFEETLILESEQALEYLSR